MFCDKCNDVRIHEVNFVEAEENQTGTYIWFTRMCTGLSACDNGKLHPIRKTTKRCNGYSMTIDLPLNEWLSLVAGGYY